MNALSYYKQFSNVKTFNLGAEIGYGADGQVFDLKDDSSKVVKIGVLYDVHETLSLDDSFNAIEKNYRHFINGSETHFVNIFEFGMIGKGTRNTVAGPENYIVYYIIQEKLFSMSEDEKKALKTVCDVINGVVKNSKPVSSILKDLNNWFDFDYSKVNGFFEQVKCSKIQHLDFHRRNILKDANGCFRLIDLERLNIN
jgi:hypothetical protein